MFSIAIIDVLGLTYDGTTLNKRGLGGSESAVILMSRELSKLGFSVTVFNNCLDSQASEGIYDNVNYIDLSRLYQKNDYTFDVIISSRTLLPFVTEPYWGYFNPNPMHFKKLKDNAKLKIVWMHDTFCGGDHLIEEHLINGDIDEIFTLSDFHTSYITTCTHGPKRNFEVLKDKVFITRNGIVNYFDEVDISRKDKNLFVYNASVTKGMLPLVQNIWERVKREIPDAKLKVIGGYYRFRENAEPDEQEKTWRELVKDPKYVNLDVEFTGIIKQSEIAEILSKASYMIYPGAFPETFGISSLESLCYNTPLITTRFGALEETAIDQASYFIDYAIEPNGLYPHINSQIQEDKFVNLVLSAYRNPYLHQQKMYYCNIIKDVCGWDTVALQWKQHLFKKLNAYLSLEEYRKVRSVNYNIHKIFGRRHSNKEEWVEPKNIEQRIVVVSTFYNAENYIEKCIVSVASQDYNNYCHILVNDCSTDNSREIAENTIKRLPENIREKFILLNREKNEGAVYNQIMTFRDPFIKDDDIIMILDGDDWLVNDPDIFDFYNNLYQNDETEFSYGSCWSIVDNIPLISQPYPKHILEKKSYREHKFNWGLPYTHLRTFKKRLINNINDSVFLNENGEWFRAGGDVATFYNIIEQADSKKVKCVSRIVYNYNDANPLNDYKVNSDEQNKTARLFYNDSKKFSIIVPTMWRCKNLFKRTLEGMVEHSLIDEILIINNEVESTPSNWNILSNHKIKMKNQLENIKVNRAWNLGVEESKNEIICLLNDDVLFDLKLFDKIKDKIIPESGVYGLITGEDKFNHPQFTDGSIDFIEWKLGDNIHGFGQLMFLHRNNWKPIIDGLEIYFGDDFIFHSQLLKNLKNYKICNIIWESPMASTTSDVSITGGVYEKERPIWEKYFIENPFQLNDNMLIEESKNMKKKILIAIPTAKYIEPQTFKSIFDLEVSDDCELDFQYFYGYNIEQIRNLIAHWAVNYDYLFSVDSDISFEKNTLTKMLNHDKDIISGLYIQRKPNEHILEIYEKNQSGGVSNISYEKIKNKGLLEIAGCGFGCVLIKSEVIRKIGYPQFVYKSAIDHKDTVSEDVYFCMKAIENGFKIYADTSILCQHIGNYVFRVE